jgi:hypothetical protein
MERSFIHHKTGEVSVMKTERIGSNSIVPEARMLLRETDAEWSSWSDREIARRCGVDDKTVGKLRLEIEENNSILRKFRSMERSFIHHKTGEVSIMKLRGDAVLVLTPSIEHVTKWKSIPYCH